MKLCSMNNYKRHYNPTFIHPLYYCEGTRQVYKFENEFGASVISGKSTRIKMSANHPYELMLLFTSVPNYYNKVPEHLRYLLTDTEGYLSQEQLDVLLDQIAAL